MCCLRLQVLTSFPIDTADGGEVALLWDSAGVEDRLYTQGELNYLLEGNLVDGTDLMQPITNSIATFRPMPLESDRMYVHLSRGLTPHISPPLSPLGSASECGGC